MTNARTTKTLTSTVRGVHAEAAAEAEALARQGGLLSIHLYDMCCVFSRASAAANHDAKAIDFLRRAIGQGWGNPQVMTTDHDVEPLRAREDFQKLVADLEAKTKE